MTKTLWQEVGNSYPSCERLLVRGGIDAPSGALAIVTDGVTAFGDGTAGDPVSAAVVTDGVTAFGNGTPGSPISAVSSPSAPSVATYSGADVAPIDMDPTDDRVFLESIGPEIGQTFVLPDGVEDGHLWTMSVNVPPTTSNVTVEVTSLGLGGGGTVSYAYAFGDLTSPGGMVLQWNATKAWWGVVSLLNMILLD